MAIALYAKDIYCSNCKYAGSARVLGTGCGLWLLWLATLGVSVVFPPLLLVSALMLLWLVFKPAKQVCPECGNAFVMSRTQAKRAGHIK